MNVSDILKRGLLAGALACGGCNAPHDPTAAGNSDPKVESTSIIFPEGSTQLSTLVVEAVTRSDASTLQLNGHLTWDEGATVRVFPAFAGRISRVLGDPGAKVERGQPLAIIASPDFGQAQADARKAVANLALAEKTVSRVHELAAHGAAAAKDVAMAEADVERAQAELSRSTLRLTMSDSPGEAIDNNYILKSTIDGVVAERNVSPGQEVRPDQMLAGTEKLAAPLFVVTDPTRLWLIFDATEANLPLLHPGQLISLRPASFPDRRFDAKIDLINEALDPVARTIRIRASVKNPDRVLKAEMLVQVEANSAESTSFDVPERTIFFKEGHQYLFTELARGHYQRKEVIVGAGHDRKIQVTSGLKPGDRVVVDGAILLQQVLDTAGNDSPAPAESSKTPSP